MQVYTNVRLLFINRMGFDYEFNFHQFVIQSMEVGWPGAAAAGRWSLLALADRTTRLLVLASLVAPPAPAASPAAQAAARRSAAALR
jgi:hypothetical protein